MRNKHLGMLLGLHCGDALGATLEFQPSVPKVRWQKDIVGKGVFNWNPGDATDDTDLMLCVLESVQGNTFDLQQCSQKMIAWLLKGPLDVGGATRLGIEKQMVKSFVNNNFSKAQGNGSLMRCAPLALLHLPFQELDKVAKTQTQLTHAYDTCVESDRIFLRSCKRAILGDKKEDILEQAIKECNSEEIKSRLGKVKDLPWQDLETSGYVVDSLCVAFWALMNFNSLEEALIAVINRGDDSDTSGAIAGALCGAYYGVEALPKRWLDLLQYRHRIESLVKA